MTDEADDTDNGDAPLGTYHWSEDGQSPSLAIIDALADLQDTAPMTLDVLYNSIEPDALNRLLHHETSDHLLVEFRRGDHLITVHSDGEIKIRDVNGPDT